MGRRPYVHLNLPKGMRVRRNPGGKVYYYLDKGIQPDGKRPLVPLGADFLEALRRYADLEKDPASSPVVTVPEILTRWRDDTQAARRRSTQKDIEWCLVHLLKGFGDPPAPAAEVEPVHIRKYLNWRKAYPTTANREIAWLSAAWNWARDCGLINLPNPTLGVKRLKVAGRDMYVEDEEYAAIYAHAGDPLREAMDLAYLIGQRPCDLREILETDIKDGRLRIRQNKTDAKLEIEITGQLAELIERMRARKAALPGVRCLSLLTDEAGQPLTKSKLRRRFDQARADAAEAAPKEETAKRIKAIQFRDLRAKTGTDAQEAGGLDAAKAILGHTRAATTEIYIRKRRGAKVKPLK